LLAKKPEDVTTEERAELDACTKRLQELEGELRAAIVAEPEAEPRPSAEDSEGREYRRLVGSVSLRRYMAAAMEQRALTDGPEAELRQAQKLADHQAPWEALLPLEPEVRADAATTIPDNSGQTNQASVLARVFADSAAAHLRMTPVTVAAGTASYPVMTGGVTPATVAKGATQDAQAGSFSITQATPHRMSARYLWRVEDAAQCGRQLENALRADLRQALAHGLDSAVFNGSGTVEGLLDDDVLTAPADPAKAAAWADFAKALASGVDGLYGKTVEADVRIVAGVETWQLAYQTFLLNSGVSASAAQQFPQLAASASIPDPASNIQGAVLSRGAGGAVFLRGSLRLLRDLQREAGLAMLFITHDFGIVAKLCQRLLDMYAGRVVEAGPVRAVFNNPSHPYTSALLGSVVRPDSRVERLQAIEGQPPALWGLPPGCRFAPRCPHADDRCRTEYPPAIDVQRDASGHVASCWSLENPDWKPAPCSQPAS